MAVATIETRAQAELLRRARLGKYQPYDEKRYRAFGERYAYDLAGFICDCIQWPEGQGPTAYQVEVAEHLVEDHRASVRGPHGLGKTSIAAMIILGFALTRDALEIDWKIPTTASAWRQLTHYLWPEIHKWGRALDWRAIGREPLNRYELQVLRMRLDYGEAFALASDDPSTMEGAHADHILYVYDEAKVVPDGTFDASEGAFAGAGEDTPQEAYALAISTPGEPVGRFYEIHARRPGYEEWWARHVTKKEAIDAGRMSAEWAENRARQWGEDSAIYQNRVEGEFAVQTQDAVIPLAWIEAANERWKAWQERGGDDSLTHLAFDVGGGREGNDESVIALVYDGRNVIIRREPLAVDPEIATMELAGKIAGILQANNATLRHVNGDIIGIGAGVVHRLRELGWRVFGFHAGKATGYLDESMELGYNNVRSCGWWSLRELLSPAAGLEIALPPDDGLTGDLTAVRVKRINSRSQREIESKDEIKKRIHRSPDAGDAVMQAFTGPIFEREAQGPVVTRVIDLAPNLY